MSKAPHDFLLTSYFPRSMKLEGGTALIDAVARGLTSTGLDVAIHAPLEVRPDQPYTVIDYHRDGRLSYFGYLRDLAAISGRFRVLLSLDHSPATGLVSGWALRRHPRVVHYYVSPCQPLTEILKPPYSVQYFKHWLGKNVVLGHLSAAKRRTSIVATRYQGEQLRALGVAREDIVVIPYGITRERSLEVPQREARARHELPGGPLVGYLGHFSPIKGVPVLVEAFERLLDRVPDCHLALAWSGKGADAAKVQQMIRRPAIRDSVSLLGVVDPGAFLSSLDLCVLPYVHSSTPHYPLVMLESLAVGTPVVSTRVGGLEECAAGTGSTTFVAPNDPSQLASTLERLLGDGSGESVRRPFPEEFRAEVAARRLREAIS